MKTNWKNGQLLDSAELAQVVGGDNPLGDQIAAIAKRNPLFVVVPQGMTKYRGVIIGDASWGSVLETQNPLG